MKSKRAALAVIIVALWLGGMAMMLRRNANRSEGQQLAEVALRVQPATFYYLIEQDGQRIGAAASAVDTTTKTLISDDYFVGDLPPAGGTSPVRTFARWQTRLTRGFRLRDLTIDVARATRPLHIEPSVEADTLLLIGATRKRGWDGPTRFAVKPPLFTPSLAPVAFMLGGPHTIGRKQTLSVFDPTTRNVIRAELQIRAESLFTVVDSATQASAGIWKEAHRDTVRAWKIEDAPRGLTAWIDAEGRVVAAQAGSLSAIRTAFEIAFKNAKTK
jgi:hypothetical protein